MVLCVFMYSRGVVASNASLRSMCVYPVLFFNKQIKKIVFPKCVPLRVLKSGSASARASSVLVRFFTGILDPLELPLILHAVCFVGIPDTESSN